MRKRLIQLSLGLLIYPVAVPAQEAMVNISVESRPKSALIFVDREYKGKGSVTLQLPAGKHLLRVAGGEDYEPNQKEFFLQGGQPQTFVITLSPSARKWIQQGQALLAKGNFQEAQQLFHKSRNSLPVEGSWWEGVAAMQLHTSQGDKDAVSALRLYAQYMPKNPELHLLLGKLYQRQSRWPEAVTAYKSALLLSEKLPDALKNLPEPTFENIRKMPNASPLEQLRKAQLLMLKGDHSAALDWLSKAAAAIYPDWDKTDWLTHQPKLPSAPNPEVAPPEDQPNNR